MPTFSQQTFASYFKRILQFGHSGNNGTPTATTNIQAGDGVATSLSLSDDVLKVQPVNDDTTGTFLVKNQGGDNIFTIDTSGTGTGSTATGRVLMGKSQVAANTQYANFGVSSTDAAWYNTLANTHYAVPFTHTGTTSSSAIASVALGTSTNPGNLTIATSAMDVVLLYWFVMDDITVDAVKWWHGADTATGDTTRAHLMSYGVDVDNGSTSGDLSDGVVIADGGDITNAGYEQAYYQSLTVQSADVDAGRAILFVFRADSVNSDYSINATVKYHIR